MLCLRLISFHLAAKFERFFELGQVLYHIISFINKIFHFTRTSSQLPKFSTFYKNRHLFDAILFYSFEVTFSHSSPGASHIKLFTDVNDKLVRFASFMRCIFYELIESVCEQGIWLTSLYYRTFSQCSLLVRSVYEIFTILVIFKYFMLVRLATGICYELLRR